MESYCKCIKYLGINIPKDMNNLEMLNYGPINKKNIFLNFVNYQKDIFVDFWSKWIEYITPIELNVFLL